MVRNVNQQKDEMNEIGVVKYYSYIKNHYGGYGGRYEKDCGLFVKFINSKPILLAEINDKMHIIEIGDFKKYGDNFNGKIGMDQYYLNIPTTVISIMCSSFDK